MVSRRAINRVWVVRVTLTLPQVMLVAPRGESSEQGTTPDHSKRYVPGLCLNGFHVNQ
jgi:hypothetical protein